MVAPAFIRGKENECATGWGGSGEYKRRETETTTVGNTNGCCGSEDGLRQPVQVIKTKKYKGIGKEKTFQRLQPGHRG